MSHGVQVVVIGDGQAGLAADTTRAAWAWTSSSWTPSPLRAAPGSRSARRATSPTTSTAVVLFDVATARRRALDAGRSDTGGVASLGDIVAVPPVRTARDAGPLRPLPMFTRLTEGGIEWADGSRADADAVLGCTGFRPALSHLNPLGLRQARDPSRPKARAPYASQDCTCSVTATGPDRLPPR
jgi:putative flavoprotein involved in K+ transport